MVAHFIFTPNDHTLYCCTPLLYFFSTLLILEKIFKKKTCMYESLIHIEQ